MNQGKIVFLAANASYAHTNLAGWYLRASAAPAGWQWREVEALKNDAWLTVFKRVLQMQPDALAASFYLFNRQFLLAFIKRFKALRPACPVIAGGPEFNGENFSFLQQHPEIDAVVRGEGERAFAQWLACWRQRQKWGQIRGLCAFIDGNYVDNGRAGLIENLDEIPSPYAHGLPPGNFGEAAWPEKKVVPTSGDRPAVFPKPFLLLETSRGCSNHCSFCTSAGEKVRYFSMERVRRDIAAIAASGVKTIRLADRTFNENIGRCRELLKIMRGEFPQMKFHLEIDPARVSSGLLEEFAAAAPGQLHLEVGIQATQPEVIRALGRSGAPERALVILAQLCRLRNLAVHVDLLAGLPGQSLADVYADAGRVALMQPAEIQLEVLKLLPGTRLRAEAGTRGIIFAAEPPYEALQTPGMPAGDVMQAHFLSNLVDWFYNLPELQVVFIEALRQLPGFIGRFCAFCGDKAGASQAPALENRFRLLEQFCRQHVPALLPRLAYAWLKRGLSARQGLCPVTPWKKPVPEGARLVEGSVEPGLQRAYMAELDKKYLFVYGRHPRRAATAIYVF